MDLMSLNSLRGDSCGFFLPETQPSWPCLSFLREGADMGSSLGSHSSVSLVGISCFLSIHQRMGTAVSVLAGLGTAGIRGGQALIRG